MVRLSYYLKQRQQFKLLLTLIHIEIPNTTAFEKWIKLQCDNRKHKRLELKRFWEVIGAKEENACFLMAVSKLCHKTD